MSKLIKNRYRILALLILTLVFGAATYGFAASNTVPSGTVGEGSGVISGYTVDNVKYVLRTGSPGFFESVHFDLLNAAGTAPAAASDVHAGLGAGGAVEWVSCSPGTGAYDFDCVLNTTLTTVLASDALHVASAE